MLVIWPIKIADTSSLTSLRKVGTRDSEPELEPLGASHQCFAVNGLVFGATWKLLEALRYPVE